MTPETPETPGASEANNADAVALAAVIRSRFQSMPEIAALALAQSPPMADVLNVQVAFRKAIESPHIRSDFVSATLWSLLQSSLAQLEALSAPNSLSLRHTVLRSVQESAGHPTN